MGLLDITSWFGKNHDSVVYEKTYDRNDWYFVSDKDGFSTSQQNLAYALDHPILTSALLFISNLFAQAHFKVVDKTTRKEVIGHKLTKLLNKPNYYQTRIDFLEAFMFLKISQGKAIIWLKKIPGFNDEPTDLYLLREDLITYPEGFKTKHIYSLQSKQLDEQHIIYDKDGANIKIKFGDLMFYYDLPNISNKDNMFESRSRLDGLHQTLNNTYDSLIAKNIILKSNGKEMISGGTTASGGFPFGGREQKEAQTKFNTMFGLGAGRSRLWMTKANVLHKNLHVPLRDLGLDESVKVDGNIIYTNLHIPKDILSLEAKKTTYNNFKESMTSFIQNESQSQANDFCDGFIGSPMLKENEELVGSYDHLPVMQFIEKERYEGVNIRMTALANARKAGLSDEEALDIVGLPTTLILNPLIDGKQEESTNQEGSEGNKSEEGEED